MYLIQKHSHKTMFEQRLHVYINLIKKKNSNMFFQTSINNSLKITWIIKQKKAKVSFKIRKINFSNAKIFQPKGIK